jgi:hypothetical protein
VDAGDSNCFGEPDILDYRIVDWESMEMVVGHHHHLDSVLFGRTCLSVSGHHLEGRVQTHILLDLSLSGKFPNGVVVSGRSSENYPQRMQ